MRLASLPTGRWAKWIVLVVWIALAIGLGGLGGKLSQVQKNEATEWLPKSAESTQVFKQSEAFVAKDTIPALVIYSHPDGGPVTPADVSKADADGARIAKIVGITGVKPAVTSQDGKAAMVIADFHLGPEGWDVLGPAIKDIRDLVKAGNAPGVQANVTGPGGYSGDFALVFSGFDSTLLLVTAGIVIVILLLTYRSPILWVLPLLCVGIALGVAEGIVYLLAKNDVLTVNGQSSFILIVLVFGASTDYALLLIARYREELRHHEDRHKAMAVALRRAGPAIIASGATVSLAMFCLLFAELASTKSLGPVMAVGVIFGLLAVLAGQTAPRRRRRDRTRLLGPGRHGRRPPSAGHLDRHRDRARPARLGPVHPRHRRSPEPRCVPQQTGLRDRGGGPEQALPGRFGQPDPGDVPGRRRAEGRRPAEEHPRRPVGQRPGDQGLDRLHRGDLRLRLRHRPGLRPGQIAARSGRRHLARGDGRRFGGRHPRRQRRLPARHEPGRPRGPRGRPADPRRAPEVGDRRSCWSAP
jgi:hypothetical protein